MKTILKWCAPAHVAGVPAELCHLPPRDLTVEQVEAAGYRIEQLLDTGLWEMVEEKDPQAGQSEE